MKLLPVAALVLSLPVLAPADWVMENRIESSRVKIAATIKSKGDKFRVDVSGGPRGAVSTILDISTGDLVQLVHDKKEARKIPGEALRQRQEALKKNAPATPEAAAPKSTGEKEKIGDWQCDIYTWSNDKATARIWLATNLPKADEIKAMMEKLKTSGISNAQSGPDTAALPGVVVKTETTTASGKSIMTVGPIKEQELDASEFAVPADYEVKTPPANLRGVPPAATGEPGAKKETK